MANGATYEEVSNVLEMNAFERWYFDVDKVSTDGKDDGKLSAGEIVESSAKGFFGGILKGMVKNPITTALTIGLGTAATIATGGAALPIIIGLGAAASAFTIGTSAYNYAKANNDYDAKMALEGMGTGTAGLALAAVGVKSANKAAANAGVKSLQGLDKASWTENAVEMVKAIPESFRQSGLNIKGNYLTWKTGVIHPNSNATRTGVETGYQTGNKVQDAYKVDLNGTVEEVLAKNPGLKYDAEAGKFYVETSWGENMYVQNENYMYVKYGESVDPKTGKVTIDHNAVEGKEFYDTYIDHAKFEANGTKRYINPENLKPGQHVETSKNAQARYKVVPEGTKYMSAEGEGTVQPNSVLRIDGQGRPYQSTVDFMTKKVQLSDAQLEQMYKLDPAAVYKNKPAWMQANHPETYSAIVEKNNFIADLKLNAQQTIKNPEDISMLQNRIDTYSDLVVELSKSKMPDGSLRFTGEELNTLLCNLEESTLENPTKIFDAIAKADRYNYGPGAFGVWKCLYY